MQTNEMKCYETYEAIQYNNVIEEHLNGIIIFLLIYILLLFFNTFFRK
jgi:hypothetical protein